jgi:Tfp pilus assembly protein PilF
MLATMAAVLVASANVVAQTPQRADRMPPRPKLEADRDTNDWHSYYWHGIETLTTDADEASNSLFWAIRLDPSAPEPYHARALALLADEPRRLIEYMYGSEDVLRSKEGREADSLMHEALRRNPFMQSTLEQRLIRELFTRITGLSAAWMTKSHDPASEGFDAFNKGQMGIAATKLGEALTRRPDRLALRVLRAHALAMGGDGDSAIVELTRVVDEMQKHDQKKLVSIYDSKAQFLYEIGILHAERGRADAARDAFGRALVEDLSFYLAHARLAELALRQNDPSAAIAEYEQAVQLRPNEGTLRVDYGVALVAAKRLPEAEAQFRRATELEPFFAKAWFDLGATHELLGHVPQAALAYKTFIACAPRSMADQRQRAQDLLDVYALQQSTAPNNGKPNGPPDSFDAPTYPH